MSQRVGFWTLQRMVLALALVGGAGTVAVNWRDWFPTVGLSATWSIDAGDVYAIPAAISWSIGPAGGGMPADHNEVGRHGTWARTTSAKPGDLVVLEVLPANSRALTRCWITWKDKIIAKGPPDDFTIPFRRGRGASCHAVIPPD